MYKLPFNGGTNGLVGNNIELITTLFIYLQLVVALSTTELLRSPNATSATLAAISEGLNTKKSAPAIQILKL
jgi:hypothetical protein